MKELVDLAFLFICFYYAWRVKNLVYVVAYAYIVVMCGLGSECLASLVQMLIYR